MGFVLVTILFFAVAVYCMVYSAAEPAMPPPESAVRPDEQKAGQPDQAA